MRVERWIPFAETEGLTEAIGATGGWVRGHRWPQFLERYPSHKHPYYEAIRTDVVAKRIRFGGDWHQNDPSGCPVFEDGTTATFTYRAWGDMLAAIWNSEENGGYEYMSFYMGSVPERGEPNPGKGCAHALTFLGMCLICNAKV